MARNDADLEVYVAARWSMLVGVLDRLGHGSDAGEIAVRGLARSYHRWERVRRQDVDVQVLGDLLHEAPASVRGRERDVRAALQDVAALSDDQADAVLDLAARPRLSRRRGHERAVPTDAPPALGVVAAAARAGRRRRARRALMTTGVVALALALLSWTAARSGPTVPEPQVGWYVDGVLHERDGEVRLPAVRWLLRLDQGTVWVTDAGVVGRVVDGHHDLLGRSRPEVRPVVSSDGSQLAWVETAAGTAAVVVRDVVRDRTLGRLGLATHRVVATSALSRIRLVALDGPVLHYSVDGEDFGWTVGSDEASRPEGSGLLDLAAGVRVRQDDHALRVELPRFAGAHEVTGERPVLSTDGRYLVTRVAEDEAGEGRPFRVSLFDTGTGARLPSGLAREELALDAAFGDGPTLTYLVVPRRDPAAGVEQEVVPRVVVRTCRLPSVECDDRPSIAPGEGRSLLAG